MAPTWDDQAAHISSVFPSAFPTWPDFRRFLESNAAPPEYGVDRILHQVLSADFAQRLAAVEEHDWILMGSLSLPGRTDPNFWPVELTPSSQSTVVPPAYAMARSAFDLDLCARDITDPDPDQAARLYGTTVHSLIMQVAADSADPGIPHGLGLGGLVRYSAENLTVHPNGQVMGIVTAQPLDPRYGPRATIGVDEPINVEIDIKPPIKARFDGPAEPSRRPVVGVSVPGMSPYAPPLFPTANQLADKVCLLAGPPVTMRAGGLTGPWHRYKDLFDSYFLIKTCQIDSTAMQDAVASNWNLERAGLSRLPRPYRLYASSLDDEHPVPWREACDRLRALQPELSRYPDWQGLSGTVSAFLDSLATAAPDSTWTHGRTWAAPHQDAADSLALSRPQGFHHRPAQAPSDSPHHPDQPERDDPSLGL